MITESVITIGFQCCPYNDLYWQFAAFFHSFLSLNVRVHNDPSAFISAPRHLVGGSPTSLLRVVGNQHASLLVH